MSDPVPDSFEPAFTHDTLTLHVRPRRWPAWPMLLATVLGGGLAVALGAVVLIPAAAVVAMLTVLAVMVCYAMWMPRVRLFVLTPTGATLRQKPDDGEPIDFRWSQLTGVALDAEHRILNLPGIGMFGVGPRIDGGAHPVEDLRWLEGHVADRIRAWQETEDGVAERQAVSQLAAQGRDPAK